MDTATEFVPCTYKQYAKAVRDQARSLYGISVAKAETLYPDHFLRPEWVKELVAHAAVGGDIPASVARTLTSDERYAVNKFGYSHMRYI